MYDIKKEICFQKICAENGLCKDVEDWWICKNGKHGVIITKEIIGDSFLGEINKNKKTHNFLKTMLKKAFDLIHSLHKLGISRRGVKSHDIRIDNEGNLYFTNMGCSDFIENSVDLITDYKTFITEMSLYSIKKVIDENIIRDMDILKVEDFIYNNIIDIISKKR